ncbi:MAG: YaiI/YqxD family protein [Burkholderiales bacterium]|nr:YaiI/YqxD family protein [Burkholderiales bacterium]
MRVWVDADACPGPVKEILFRAADRVRVHVTLVANQPIATPRSPFVHFRQVERGDDMADRRIAEALAAGDMVVTADMPLAAEAVRRGALALSPRGERYDAGNVAQALAMRDFMTGLRAAGVDTGGPAPFRAADTRAFARELDRLLQTVPPAGARRPADG